MKAFEVSGRFKISDRWQKFRIEVATQDEAAARERIMTILGSRHKTPRRLIEVESIRELPAEEIEDARVRYRVGAGVE